MNANTHKPLEQYLCWPVSLWPAQDRTLWEASLVKGDILEPDGPRAGHSPVSNRKLVWGYGRWLSWMHERGELDQTVAPADRITRDRIIDYVRDLQTRNSTRTLINRLDELRAIAKIFGPGRDWSFIRRIAAPIERSSVPARPKRTRLVEADALVALGQTLMSEAANEQYAHFAAMTFRDGLIIALLALRPMRRRNLAALELDRHVVKQPDGWWIIIPGSETKTGAPIELPWPNELISPLEAYITIHRPVLMRLRKRSAEPMGKPLWVSRWGVAMSAFSIYKRIRTLTRERLGRELTVHLFRDSAASTLANADPDRVLAAARLLGHGSAAATETYYIQANQIAASRKLQATISELRRQTRT